MRPMIKRMIVYITNSLVLLLFDVIVFVVVFCDLHLFDHLGRRNAEGLVGETGGKSADERTATKQEEEGNVGDFAEGDDEGHEERGRPGEGDVDEDGEVAHLCGVGLADHDSHNKIDDGAAHPIDEEHHIQFYFAVALSKLLREPHADCQHCRGSVE
jgi:hypothetical protein